MKAKVLKQFKDKNTKERYKAGQEINITKKRFEEMNSTAFGVLVEEIKEPKEVKAPSSKPKPAPAKTIKQGEGPRKK